MGAAYEATIVGVQGNRTTKIKVTGKPRKPVIDEPVTMSEGLITHVKEMYAKRMDEIMAQIMKDSRK